MKTTLFLCLCLSIAGCLWTPEKIPVPCPEIDRVFPTLAPANTFITVIGRHFCVGRPDLHIVRIGNLTIPKDQLEVPSEDTLRILVPSQPNSGKISIELETTDECIVFSEQDFFYQYSAQSTIVFAGQIAGTFFTPRGLDVDANGNVYVADRNHHVIQKITKNGVVSVFAGKLDDRGWKNEPVGTDARFYSPADVSVDLYGDVYVADESNHCIRKVFHNAPNAVDNVSGSIAEMGFEDMINLAAARFTRPVAVEVSSDGNTLFVIEKEKNRLRMLDISSPLGYVTTLLGDAEGTTSALSGPVGLAFLNGEKNNQLVFVADVNNQKIWSVNPENASQELVVSTDGSIEFPYDLAIDENGVLFVADQSNNGVFAVYPNGVVRQLAPGFNFGNPAGIAIDIPNKYLYISDDESHRIIRMALE